MVDVSDSGFKLRLHINILSLKYNCLGYGLRLRNNACLRIFLRLKIKLKL
jgi:hypothetical protein